MPKTPFPEKAELSKNELSFIVKIFRVPETMNIFSKLLLKVDS